MKFLLFPVNYKVELYDPRSGGFMPSSPGIGMHVEVKDPDDKIILSRVYSSEGKQTLKFLNKYLDEKFSYLKFQEEYHLQVTHQEST